MLKKSTAMIVKLICFALFSVMYTQANPIYEMSYESGGESSIYGDVNDAYYSDDYQPKTREDLNSTNIPSLVINEISDDIYEDEEIKMKLCMELHAIMQFDGYDGIFDKNDAEFVKEMAAAICDSRKII